MALRSQADTGDSLKTVALHLLAEGKRELGRDVRVPSSKRASEPETNMWTSPAPAIEHFHRKFPAITRALVLAQPETSDEDADDGSARVGTIETSEDARRVLKHARYVRPPDLDTAKEDTSEDDAASASGDSTPAPSPAPSPGGEGTKEREEKENAAHPNDANAAGSVSREPEEVSSPAVEVKPAAEDPRESVDPVAVSRPASEPTRAAVEPSPADAKGNPPLVSRTPSRTKTPREPVARREKPRFGFPDAASRAEAWRRGFRAWREKRGIDASVKVFIVVGSYSDARASLLRRGWVENEDRDSPYFDLKWTTRARDVSGKCGDEEARRREKTWRRPNHGKGTTRGFGSAAGDPTEVAKLQAAAFLTDVTKKKLGVALEPKHPSFLADERAAEKDAKSSRVELFPGQTVNHFVGAAAHLTTKAGLCRSLALHARWRGVGDVAGFFPRCYDLSADHNETAAFECDFENTLARSALRRALRDGGLRANGVATETALRIALRVCEHQARYEDSLVRAHASDDVPARTPLDETERAALQECPAFRTKKAKETNDEMTSSFAPLSDKLREACVAALDVLDRANPQASMEGDCSVWILKPAGKSRGRGIGCVTSLEQARRHVLKGSQGPFEQRRRAWVAQKYIERPLLIRGRKFDVRVWVFVTGVAPLRVWMWRKPYLRFCAEEYALDDVSNVFRHLSNNAVAAHSPAHLKQAMGEGNMWRLENFKAFLRNTSAECARGRAEAWGGREGGGGGRESGDIDLEHASEDDHDLFADEWEALIEPQMRSAAVATLKCAEDGLESGGKTSACQLFGYDFVIDEHMKVWLLEVNSSPCMEHSTPVTADLCPRAFHDAFEVLEDDRRRGEDARLGARRGGWELVHVGALGDDRAAAASGAAKWGVDLTVKGDASMYQREARRYRKQAQTADAERAKTQPGCAVIRTGFDGGSDADIAGGLPRAPAWEPAWQRLSKAHTRSSMAGRTVRVK